MLTTPFIIEFTGTTDSGKSTVINALESIFNSKGLRVHVIHECTKSEIKGIDRRKWNGYIWIRLRM